MSYPIQSLLENHIEPLSILPDAPASRAFDIMIEHDFSQLPIIDPEKRPLGLITHESILRCLSSFGLDLDKIRVDDALIKAPTLRPEDEISDLLQQITTVNAVLIVDAEGRLINILTSYDTFQFFRRRSEDLLLVEDVESMFKDLIQSAFTDEANQVDQNGLNQLTEEVTITPQSYRKKFVRAITELFKALNMKDAPITDQMVDRAIKYLDPPKEIKPFDRLTYNEYLELLLHEFCWSKYGTYFNIEKEPFRKLFDGVRKTRNALAHFRDEITATQRAELHYAVDWLNRRQLLIPASFSAASHQSLEQSDITASEAATLAYPALQAEGIVGPIQPTDEITKPGDSRYIILADRLRAQPGNVSRLTITFDEIEAILGGPLPDSARRHKAFWANDKVGHIHSQQWLDAGWRSTSVSMTDEKLTFVRIAEREAAYITFFSGLVNLLKKEKNLPSVSTALDGASWISLLGLPSGGPQVAWLNCSFSRDHQFRVELYIDSGNQARNKAIFDALVLKKAEIENALGFRLSWERITDKRASRIAAYHPGHITDSEPKLKELRTWAIQTIVKIYPVMADRDEWFIAEIKTG